MSLGIGIFLNKVRLSIWPIYRGERRKFALMIVMFFLISFNYNILRAVKDTFIVTAPGSGAEAIPFIKVWLMLPMAFLMTYIFTKLSNKYTLEKVFYIMIWIFLGFFTAFTLFLYPYKDYLHLTSLADHLQGVLPSGFKGVIAIIRNWTLTTFYVMSELWGTIILSVLFWGLANEVTSVKQAKRFYTLFGVGANIASIIAGQTSIYLSSIVFNPLIPYGKTAWDQSVLYITITILISGFAIMGIFKYLNIKELKPDLLKKPISNEPKQKQTLKKSFAYLSKSKYLICIAVIVITYNICINLVEIVWKNQVRLLYPGASEFNAYMGEVMSFMGVIATIIALFISGNVLRKFSWTANALMPPLIMITTGIAFFAFLLFNNYPTLAVVTGLLGSTPLIMGVFFGTLQNCMARASKYTLFDATKELAFIPLATDSKLKGKAAIDGVGSRLGKSGGSIIHQGLLIMFSTIAACTPYIAGIFLVVVLIWITAVVSLGKQFSALTSKKDDPLPPDAEGLKTAKEAVDVAMSKEKAPADKKSEQEISV
jgi:ATP:ADP antiporter, AAA family